MLILYDAMVRSRSQEALQIISAVLNAIFVFFLRQYLYLW